MDKRKIQFWAQKGNAKRRGISWEMSFKQWCDIWDKSGHYEQRGPRRGQYVMCRDGDQGPYRPDNVYIRYGRENIREYLDSEQQRKALRRRGRYVHARLQMHEDNLCRNDPLEILLKQELDIENGVG